MPRLSQMSAGRPSAGHRPPVVTQKFLRAPCRTHVTRSHSPGSRTAARSSAQRSSHASSSAALTVTRSRPGSPGAGRCASAYASTVTRRASISAPTSSKAETPARAASSPSETPGSVFVSAPTSELNLVASLFVSRPATRRLGVRLPQLTSSPQFVTLNVISRGLPALTVTFTAHFRNHRTPAWASSWAFALACRSFHAFFTSARHFLHRALYPDLVVLSRPKASSGFTRPHRVHGFSSSPGAGSTATTGSGAGSGSSSVTAATLAGSSGFTVAGSTTGTNSSWSTTYASTAAISSSTTDCSTDHPEAAQAALSTSSLVTIMFTSLPECILSPLVSY